MCTTIIGNSYVCAWLKKTYSAYLPYWCSTCRRERIKPFPSAATALYYSPRLFDGYAIRTVSVHLGLLLTYLTHSSEATFLGADTVLHCEVNIQCVFSLKSMKRFVFFFIDSHYIGSQMWCTARGLKIRGVCSSHSRRHKRTNNTNIVKLAFI